MFLKKNSPKVLHLHSDRYTSYGRFNQCLFSADWPQIRTDMNRCHHVSCSSENSSPFQLVGSSCSFSQDWCEITDVHIDVVHRRADLGGGCSRHPEINPELEVCWSSTRRRCLRCYKLSQLCFLAPGCETSLQTYVGIVCGALKPQQWWQKKGSMFLQLRQQVLTRA